MYKCSHMEALDAAERGCKFSMVWEYVGSNASNKSGNSDKFWAVENDGQTYIRYGKRGTVGTIIDRGISLDGALARANLKIKKGYSWAGATAESDPASHGVLPLISESLPSPWNRIRMIHEQVAYDQCGDLVVKLTPDSAKQICSSYTLA